MVPRLLLLLAAFVVIGCGGDDGDGGDDGTTRAEFAEQVNAVCDDFREQLADIPPPQTQAESREFNVKATEVEEEFVRRLMEQDPPDDVAAEYEEYASAHAEALELVGRIREARDRGDDRAADRLQDEITQLTRRVDERAAELDLTSCGGSGAQ